MALDGNGGFIWLNFFLPGMLLVALSCYLWLLVVLDGSFGLQVVLGGSWFFLVVFGGSW